MERYWNALGSAEKSQALKRDLMNSDLEAFARHCATASISSPPLPEFFYWLRLYLAKAETFSFHRLKPHLTTLLEVQYPSLSLRLSAVFNLLSHGGTDDPLTKQWAREILFAAALHPQGGLLLSVADGKALVDLCLLYFQPEFFHDQMIPHVLSLLQMGAKQVAKPDLWVVGFLCRIHEKGFSRLFLTHPTTEAFRVVLDTFLEADRFCYYVWFPEDASLKNPMPLSPDNLAELFAHLVNHELYPQLAKLISNISTQIHRVPSENEFHHFWLPFLHSLIETFRKSFIPLPALQYRPMFRGILETYYTKKSTADEANFYAERNRGSLLSPPAGDQLRTELTKFDPDKLRELLGDESFEALLTAAGMYPSLGHAQGDQSDGQIQNKSETTDASAPINEAGQPLSVGGNGTHPHAPHKPTSSGGTESASVLSPASSGRFSDG